MNQEETKENPSAADSAQQTNSEEIENLPIESIGSYGRIEELMTDEDADSSDSRKPTD